MITHRKYRYSLAWLILIVIIQLMTGQVTAHPQWDDDLHRPPLQQSKPPLSLTVAASHSHLAMADTISLVAALTNTSDKTLSPVILRLPTHPDLEITAVNGRSAITTYHLDELTPGQTQEVTLTAQVIGLPRAGLLYLPFAARGEDTAWVQTQLTLQVAAPTSETAQLETAAFAQGRLRLTQVGEPTAVTFQLTQQHHLSADDTGTIIGFTLTSSQTERAQMQLNINDLLHPDLLTSDQLYLWRQATAADAWQVVPFTLDTETALLTFDSQPGGHFILNQDPEPWQLAYTPPGASEYSGAAQFSYNIQVPPGVGGLAPSLGLHYSSRGVDNRSYPVMSLGFGEGWSMPQAQISNGNAEEWYDKPGWDACSPFSRQRFTLSLNGASYPLEPNGTFDRYGVYMAVGDPSLHIEYKTDVTAGSVTAEYWLVRTADGTQYRFGYTADAEQVVAPLKEGCIVADANALQPRNDNFIVASWKIDQITDKDGNQIKYVYQTKLGQPLATRQYNLDGGGSHGVEIDVALDKIRYNFNGSSPQTEVDFNYTGHNTQLIDEITYMRVGYFRPTEIRISHNGTLTRRYAFAYDEGDHDDGQNPKGNWWIDQITEYGIDENGNEVVLPETDLFYDQDTRRGCGLNSSQQPRCISLLTQVENNYGAVTELFYDEIDNDGYWYHVTDIYTWDGVAHVHNGNPLTAASQVHYDRTGAVLCFDRVNEGCDSPGSEESKALVGFDRVVITVSAPGGADLSRQEKTFEINDYWLNGQTLTAKVVDPGTPTITLTEQLYDWTAAITTEGNRFSRLDAMESKQYAPDGSGNVMGTREAYLYQTSQQGGRQWGRRTQTTYQSLDSSGLWQTEKYDLTKYLTNETTWVMVPWATGIYEGSTPRQLTFHYYDGNTDPTAVAVNLQPITAGKLILSRSLLVDNPIILFGNTSYQTVDNYFAYGSFGNVTSATSYTGYGAEGYSSGSPNWDYATAPGGGSSSRTIQTQYSSDGLLITQITDAVGQATTFAYADSFVNTNPRFPWLLTGVTNPNNITTTYAYDPFGRLFAVYDDNDPQGGSSFWDGNPSQRYRYWDNTWNGLPPAGVPFAITVETKPATYPDPPVFGGPDYTLNHITYYDGLGRAFQERSRYAEVDAGGVSKKDLVTITEFNPLGQAACTTAPFSANPGTQMVTASCDAQHPYTSFAYDALGRQTAVTAPDDAVTTTDYNVHQNITVGDDGRLLRTRITDANGHVTTQFSNAWGQLVLVRTNSGLSGSTSKYLDTQYHYDLLGSLEQVEQREPQNDGLGTLRLQTTMTYDALGRKLTMNDPDMGSWHYTYDPNNNLTRQTDANGTVICYNYDTLNRLLDKGEGTGGGSDPCATTDPLATYTYFDNTAPDGSKGQLATTSWGDDPAHNHDAFIYDSLGRMIKQERVLDGRLYALETLTFDILERPLTLRYPDGEVITLTYDREGENSLQAGSDTIVSQIRYNVQGQPTFVARGNGKDITYSYYGATGTGGDSNFRLQTIQHGTTGDSLPDFTFNYDPVGNITSLTSGADVQTFTYDHLNRLDTVTATGGVADYSYDYNYSKLDNINQRSGTGGTITYAANSSKPHAVTHVNGQQAFWYDNNGNMTTRQNDGDDYTQVFDAENRLVQVIDNITSHKTIFVYDAGGQRTKTIQPDGTTIYYPFPNYEETTGLAGYLWPMDEGSGSAVNDASSYHQDGQVQGATWTDGVFGQALDFDGTDDYVQFDDTLDIAGDLTVSAWVRPEQAPTGVGRVVVGTYKLWNGGQSDPRGWALGDTYGDSDHFAFKVFDDSGNIGSAEVTGFFNTHLNQWVHVVGVFKPGQAVQLYVNGILAAEDTTAIPTAISQSSLFKIGARADNTDQGHWHGQIDEVQILNKSLAPSDILALNTVGSWRLNTGSGSLIYDTAHTAHDGQAQGPTWTDGISGQALDFDGTDDYIQFDDTLDIAGDLTVSAWVRPEQAPTGVGRVVVGTYKLWNGGQSDPRGWALGDTYGDSDHFAFKVFDDSGNVSSAEVTGFFNTHLNQWVHVVGVFKPGQAVQLYVNGILAAEDTTAIPTAIGQSSVFKIGARADNTDQGHWHGQIDEVQIFAQAMSATDIQALNLAASWHLDAAKGNLAEDTASYQHDGQVQGATWTTGAFGQALDFDGTDDYVQFDDTLDIAGDLTVSAWVRPEQAPTGVGRVVVGTYKLWNGGQSDPRGWALGDTYGDSDHFAFKVFDDSGNVSSAEVSGFFNTHLNQWVHVVGVFKPGQAVQLYVNGTLAAEDTTAIPTAISQSSVFKIGARADNTDQGHWQGQIDEVQIFAQAMSAADIQAMTTPLAELGPIDGLVKQTRRRTYSIARHTAVRVSGDPNPANNGLFYLHSDHLGSANGMSDGAGNLVGTISRFAPFGEYRTGHQSDIIDLGFTGHKENRGIGLTYMNARFYVPGIGRFASADTLVPDPINPQSYNRYSYVDNNPTRFNDPSGHCKNGRGTGPETCQVVGALSTNVDPWVVAKHTYKKGQDLTFGPQGTPAPEAFGEISFGPAVFSIPDENVNDWSFSLEVTGSVYLGVGGGVTAIQDGHFEDLVSGFEGEMGQGIDGEILGFEVGYVWKKIAAGPDGYSLEKSVGVVFISITDGISIHPETVVLGLGSLVEAELLAGNDEVWADVWEFIYAQVPGDFVFLGSITPDERYDYKEWVEYHSYIGDISCPAELTVTNGCYLNQN